MGHMYKLHMPENTGGTQWHSIGFMCARVSVARQGCLTGDLSSQLGVDTQLNFISVVYMCEDEYVYLLGDGHS